MTEFDVKELVVKAHFGHIGLPFPQWIGENKKQFESTNLKTIGHDLLNGDSPYFMQVTLSYQGQKFTFPNEPLVSLSQSKTIVETATVNRGRKGTVKELINTNDYQISFRGICFSEDMESYPADQVSILNQMMEIEYPLEVENNLFFELFQIRKIVLKDIQFDEMAGQQGLQSYVITAISDQDFYADLSERALANLTS